MVKLLQAVMLGVVIGILIAPDKGTETRKKLLGKLSDYKENAEDYVSDTADTVKDKVQGIADNVKSKVRGAAGKVKSKAEDVQDNVDES